jgi:hypothetical protein
MSLSKLNGLVRQQHPQKTASSESSLRTIPKWSPHCGQFRASNLPRFTVLRWRLVLGCFRQRLSRTPVSMACWIMFRVLSISRISNIPIGAVSLFSARYRDEKARNPHVRARWEAPLSETDLYTPAGAMGQGWKYRIHGDYFRRIVGPKAGA